jgi:putative endonuclease
VGPKAGGIFGQGWHLYIIRCSDGSLYTGITTDVDRRFAEHNGDGGKGSKYLRGKKPLSLVFRANLGDKSSALKAESRIKKLPKNRKEMLIKSGLSPDILVR